MEQTPGYPPARRFRNAVFAVRNSFKTKTALFYRAFPAAGAVFILIACRDPVIPPAYRLILPAVPSAWDAVLGPPRWRIEWFGPDGRLHSGEGSAAAPPEVTIPVEWASPVLAYPFWPDRELPPGRMRPAGALAPFDAEGGGLRLTWEAGPEAWFYRALAAAASGEGLSATETKRRPDRFDWPRFRDLLQSGGVPPEIREDPWLADWDVIAAKTVQSGFDRRRIRARSHEDLTICVPWPGPWVGSSPFAEVRHWEAGETVTIAASPEADTLISPGGMLRYNVNGAVRVSW
ncbi:MAG: hypothetical protein LBH70_00625 [Spirochaetaceae bacterium]|jgi:hypothetical protein|nr:hypothetical protein [Spirochaetaceae bacterium]